MTLVFQFAGLALLYCAAFAFSFSLKGLMSISGKYKVSWGAPNFLEGLLFIGEDGFDGAVEEASEFEG